MEFLQLSMEIVEKVTTLSRKEGMLNGKQCKNLADNFEKGVRGVWKMRSNSHRDMFDHSDVDLFRIVSKVRDLVEECCKEDPCRVAVMQINSKESFRELLLDLDCCFHTMCDISRCCYLDQIEEILKIERCTKFYPTSIYEVEEDQHALYERPNSVAKNLLCIGKDRELAYYFMGRIKGLQKSEGGGLDSVVFSKNYPSPESSIDPNLGEVASGSVYLIQWLGLASARKVFSLGSAEGSENVESDTEDARMKDKLVVAIWKEASILGGLSHPNIIKFLCCGFNEDKTEFELIMELGEMSISELLKKQGLYMQPLIAIDIMLQIASGMCYLHDMKVAHCDLKPDNVIVMNSKDVPKELVDFGYVHVKLVDFGISKVEMKDILKVLEARIIGTKGFMALEAIGLEDNDEPMLEMDALKADVFSFGMMCSEILFGKRPFHDLRLCDILKSLKEGQRPNLHETCPNGLQLLIQECWSLEPSKRPSFLDIHRRLTMVKSNILKGFSDVGAFKHEEPSPYNTDTNDSKQWLTSFKGSL